MTPSSTSSSDARKKTSGFPWGGVCAALIVLIVDAVGFGPNGPWDYLLPRMGERASMEEGVIRDRIALRNLADEADDKPRIFVLGTSRANRGINPNLLRKLAVVPTRIVKLAHAGMRPYEIGAVIEEFLPAGPDVAIMVTSELDTHRPVHILPHTAPGSLYSVVALARATGFGFAFEHRTLFLRLSAAAALDAYRYRGMLGNAGASSLRHFRDSLEERQRGLRNSPYLIEGEAQMKVDLDAAVEQLGAVFPQLSAPARRAQINQCREITRGAHVEVQMGLVRHAVQRLREAGVEVILAEGALHPLSEQYYDASTAEEFRVFARELETELGMHFLPLSETVPRDPALFKDMTHLNDTGAALLTSAIARELNAILSAKPETGGD